MSKLISQDCKSNVFSQKIHNFKIPDKNLYKAS